MFLFLLQFVIVFIYCAHGFALAFSLITRRDYLIELGLGVRSVSMWLFAFALYTVLLTVIAVSYTHLTLPTIALLCRSRWSTYH